MRQLKCTSKNPEDSTFIKAMRVNLYQNVRKIEFKLAHSEGHSVQDKFFKIRIQKKPNLLRVHHYFSRHMQYSAVTFGCDPERSLPELEWILIGCSCPERY